MSQLYVPEGTFLVCSEGMKKNQLKGGSQTSIYISGGKLATTINDRFEDNFICGKMMLAGAIVGAIVAAAVVAAIILSGGTIGIGIAMAVGAVGATQGAVMGANLSIIPSICSLLCTSSKWYPVHDKVLLQNQPALLETSQITCSFGGHIMILYSERAADEFVALARNKNLIQIGGTILGGALLSGAIAGILSGGAMFLKNIKFLAKNFGKEFAISYAKETSKYAIAAGLASYSADKAKEISFELIQESTGFRIKDYTENKIVEEVDEKLGNTPLPTKEIDDTLEILNPIEAGTGEMRDPERQPVVDNNYEEVTHRERVRVLNDIQTVEPIEHIPEQRPSNTARSIETTISERIQNYNGRESDPSGAFYDVERQTFIRGQELHFNTPDVINRNTRNIFISTFLENPIQGKYYEDKMNVLGLVQDVYRILTGILLEGEMKDLEEATKNEEIQTKKSITVITTTK